MIWHFWADPLSKLEAQRLKSLHSDIIPKQALPLFQHPLPHKKSRITDLTFVALDFETSGLNFAEDKILSIGSVEIKQQTVLLSTAQHYYISDNDEIIKPETAIINHIRPEILTLGLSEKNCLQQLIPYLAGKIIISHCATIEKNFLKRALNLSSRQPLPLLFLDTMLLTKSMSEYWGKRETFCDLRLTEIRKQKGLPAYLAHNAVADAIATAELFLVLISDIFLDKTVTLEQLLKQQEIFY